MSRFRGHVERRLFSAVLLVLGACDRPMEAESPTQVVVANPAPVPQDAAVVAAEPADAAVVAVAVDAAVAVVPADPHARARTLCADYKKQSRVDGTHARKAKPPPEGQNVHERTFWNAKTNTAECTIVHERVPGKVTVMHTPHWCPQSGGTRPGPTPVETPGQKILVERAWIRADGTLAQKSEVEWTAFAMSQEPRHMCGRRFEGFGAVERDARDVLDVRDVRDAREADSGDHDCDAPGAQLAAIADRDCDDGDAPGAQLAEMAELEAASVPAFDRLARELATWGAPAELVQRAREAMRDEVRHARVMSALARRAGYAPRKIAVPALPCRSLEEIARENAIEGRVREAYGALVATYQAERAKPELRAAFRAIAVDERRHVELAEDVHAWIVARLDDEARAAIEEARARAVAQLRANAVRSLACDELGLPGAGDAVALCDAYFA